MTEVVSVAQHEKYIGKRFETTRNGQTNTVVCVGVRNRKVILARDLESVDTFTIPVERFEKYYIAV